MKVANNGYRFTYRGFNWWTTAKDIDALTKQLTPNLQSALKNKQITFSKITTNNKYALIYNDATMGGMQIIYDIHSFKGTTPTLGFGTSLRKAVTNVASYIHSSAVLKTIK